MSKREPPRTATRRGLPPGYAVLALFLALIQLRLLTILLTKPVLRSLEVTEAIVHGRAAWRVFQSRVLSPWLLEGMSRVLGSWTVAFDVFAVVSIAASAWLTPELTRRLDDPRRPPLAAFLLFLLAFELLVIGNWIYAWDLLGLLLFTIFQYLVLSRAGWRPIAILFAVAIWNSETALAMAAWLVLDPLVRFAVARRSAGRRAAFDRRTLAVGALLLAGGAIVVEALRNALLVAAPTTAADGSPLARTGGDVHFTLAENLYRIGLSLVPRPAEGYPILVPAFLVAVTLLAVRLVRLEPERQAANALVAIGMVASLLCFGEIFESRVLMPLIPFVAMNGWLALDPARASERRQKDGGELSPPAA